MLQLHIIQRAAEAGSTPSMRQAAPRVRLDSPYATNKSDLPSGRFPYAGPAGRGLAPRRWSS